MSIQGFFPGFPRILHAFPMMIPGFSPKKPRNLACQARAYEAELAALGLAVQREVNWGGSVTGQNQRAIGDPPLEIYTIGHESSFTI